MHLLSKLTEVRERFKIEYPQYWLDKLTNEIREANKHLGGTGGSLVTGQVLAILRHQQANEEMIIPGLSLYTPGVNIVTSDGDIYYAQLAMSDALTDDFQAAGAGLRLGSDNTAPGKANIDVVTFLSGSDHAIDATYPQSNDSDGDNTGAGTSVMTWTYSYLTSEGNVAAIIEGAISDVRAGPSTAVLTRFLFSGVFTKTSSDTLKVIVNHTVLGV